MNWRSIRKNIQIIKQNVEDNQEFVFMLVLILIGFSAFGLGRLSALQSAREHVRILNTTIKTHGDTSISVGGKVVASRSGSKYHAPWCNGASRISEKNKIWFKDEEVARAKGYTPAKNCKGLK